MGVVRQEQFQLWAYGYGPHSTCPEEASHINRESQGVSSQRLSREKNTSAMSSPHVASSGLMSTRAVVTEHVSVSCRLTHRARRGIIQLPARGSIRKPGKRIKRE